MATDKQARVTANFGSTLDPQHPLGRLVTFHEKSPTDPAVGFSPLIRLVTFLEKSPTDLRGGVGLKWN